MPLLLPEDGYDSYLTAAASSSDTTLFVNQLPQKTAGVLTIYGIDGSTVIEKVYYTGTSTLPNRLTGVTRGLTTIDTAGVLSFAAVPANQMEHPSNVRIAMTDNVHYLGRALSVLNGDEAMGGVMQLPTVRTIDSGRDVVDREYVLGVVGSAAGIADFVVTQNGADPSLTINVAAGRYVNGAAITSYAGASAQAVVAASTNYVQLTKAGALVINQVSFTNGNIPLAEVVTDGTDITGITDRRPFITMALTPDQEAALAGTEGTPSAANPFVTTDDTAVTSTANDVVRGDANGRIDRSWLEYRFGGSGADGVLNVTAGTTTVDLANAQYVVLNYTTINISVGATLAFSNPNASGTYLVIKATGNVTIAGTLDASGLGASGGTGGAAVAATNNGNAGTSGTNSDGYDGVAHNGINGAGGTSGSVSGGSGGLVALTRLYTTVAGMLYRRSYILFPGSGGGGAGSGRSTSGNSGAGGNGGRGGAALVIECFGAWNFTGSISVNGSAGTAGGNAAAGAGSGGGGGGGSGGHLLALYNTLTANSGTATAAGGNGGAGGSGGSGAGGGSGGGGAGGLSTAGGSGGTGDTAGGVGNTPSGGGTGGGAPGGGGGGGGGSLGVTIISQNIWFA